MIVVNAGDNFDNHGTHLANPLAPATNIFNILPNDPTIINGTNIVNASFIEPRYLFDSTFALIDNKTFCNLSFIKFPSFLKNNNFISADLISFYFSTLL